MDFRALNRCLDRPHWPFVSSEQAHKQLPSKCGYLISLDLKKGHFQCPLPEESRDLTTFLCEHGRFYFIHFPQGLNASSDVFNHMSDNILCEVCSQWYLKVVDDILIFGDTKDEAYKRLETILQIFQKHGLIVSCEKI